MIALIDAQPAGKPLRGFLREATTGEAE